MKENRTKIVSIDSHLMIDIFNWWRSPPAFLRLPITDALPEDATVVSVNVDWSRRTIEALIEHPSFDVVPPGSIPPMVPEMVTEFETVEFANSIR